MNILYFSWGENSMHDFTHTLTALGHNVCIIRAVIHDYLSDPKLTASLEKKLQSSSFDFIFSFNYIPFLSELADKYQLKYVSWVYDCPHWTLYSPTISNDANFIYLFDRDMMDTVTALGAKHTFHLPLACNTARLDKLLHITENTADRQYDDDISFVGSLYELTQLNHVHYLPAHLQGYLDGMLASQKQIWGCNLIDPLLTDDVVSKLQKYIKLNVDPGCPIPAHAVFQHFILSKITSDERIAYLTALAKFYHVTLYSGSKSGLCPGVEYKGTISYEKQMPFVFYKTKINLNITLRSITSGIPLRALDIMGCGGFLLTNYQPELAELFEAGRDFIYYDNLDDLIQKAGYYLSHDIEREQIAMSGFQKVQKLFSYKMQVKKILANI